MELSKSDEITQVAVLVEGWFSENGIVVDPSSGCVRSFSHYLLIARSNDEPKNKIFCDIERSQKAISEIRKYFPIFLDNGERALAAARQNPLQKNIVDYFQEIQKAMQDVLAAIDVLGKRSKLFSPNQKKKANPRGYWHSSAYMISEFVIPIFNSFGKRKKYGFGKPTSPAVQIVSSSLSFIYSLEGNEIENEAIVKAIRAQKRKNLSV
ncbi:hypothetical protein AA0242T_2302 [Acetobacter aceti NRIC 0242]|uniref:Uncharacterized protein n=1 Tax=Acetobacter aceti NBRC 14818 TaxID=887700 RepID=A0AB33IH34_ACEAC|nr:hypothetical protein [Acetobacter aceti]TCS33053.1 hypothetical protein EDC15_109125 [Acetobacter aceti NBRC 14818]BCK76487.1 hypothetical protein EMQ_2093 [Acetobacter aceti NBRC 14818]GAN56227.1 hypothetical protein Abac_003_126 [Acetobacter aceti NBRC 14818]GBO81600.1 hypothetical protein AA0242T_2302 [Acetobacter aceti NRIC 0242]